MFILRITASLVGALLLAACGTATTTGSLAAFKNTPAAIVTAPAPTLVTTGNTMPVGTETPPPFGFVGFCQRHPSDCIGSTANPAALRLTDKRWNELEKINTEVNQSVTPVEDAELYQTAEWWAYPSAEGGDCEDYVLLKRRMLIDRGWPADALLISVVKESNGAGHAVLLVVTADGEYVLDNKTQAIRAWRDTPYTWVKRQSRNHPYVWVRTGNKRVEKNAALAAPDLSAPLAEPTADIELRASLGS